MYLLFVVEIVISFIFSLYPEWSDEYENTNPIITQEEIRLVIESQTENNNTGKFLFK